MDTIITQEEKDNKKRGMRTSVFVHIGLILLALLPLTQYQDPPPGQEGIMVNLGIPDVGEGDENAAAAAEEEEAVEETKVEEEEEVVEEQEEVVEEVTESEPEQEKEIVKTEDPEAIALKRKKEKEAKEKKEADAKKKAAADAKRKAKADADAKAAADAKAKADAKNKYGGLADGLGKGKGDTGKAGNQGREDGDPNADALRGLGKGKVGGGLGSRGVKSAPTLKESSQATGTVVIYLCVGSDGKVISSSVRVTQKGTTVQNASLQRAAVKNAKRWSFSKGGPDKQCGSISYKFKLQ